MDFKITPEIARIHAHICGDGCVYNTTYKRAASDLLSHKRKNPYKTEYRIEYWNTCKKLIKEVKKDFKIAFNRNSKIDKNFRLRFGSSKHIILKLNLENKNSYNWKIPDFIKNSSDDIISNWLRAFFDDEGSVCLDKKRISIKSMNYKGLCQVKELLFKLGIENRITGPNCDKSFYLRIYKDSLKIYKKKVDFLHPERKNKLNILIKKMGIPRLS